eukprot:12923112-Alexandrium_andersonii.AAC.1
MCIRDRACPLDVELIPLTTALDCAPRGTPHAEAPCEVDATSARRAPCCRRDDERRRENRTPVRSTTPPLLP